MRLERMVLGHPLYAEAKRLDAGWDVGVFGGCSTHVGAVTLAEPDGTAKTLERPRHRDAVVSGLWATELAKRLDEPVCVRCGIHYDNATKEDLAEILAACHELLRQLMELLEVLKEEGKS